MGVKADVPSEVMMAPVLSAKMTVFDHHGEEGALVYLGAALDALLDLHLAGLGDYD